jgi:hypothetical protein
MSCSVETSTTCTQEEGSQNSSGKGREWSFLQVQLVHKKKVLRTRPGKDGSGLYRGLRAMPSSRVLVQTDTWFFVFGSSGLRVWCLLPVPDVPYNDFYEYIFRLIHS